MAQTEEFIFQNVAYRPTVYRTGTLAYILSINLRKIEHTANISLFDSPYFEAKLVNE